jgi:hypothetical protein
MNEEEEEALRVRQNCLAWERHATRSKEQCVANASWQATQRATHSDAQIAANASRWVA